MGQAARNAETMAVQSPVPVKGHIRRMAPRRPRRRVLGHQPDDRNLAPGRKNLPGNRLPVSFHKALMETRQGHRELRLNLRIGDEDRGWMVLKEGRG